MKARARSVLIGAVAVVATAGSVQATASAAPKADPPGGESLAGLVLTGECPGQVGDLKSVIGTPRSGSMWAPIPLMTSAFVDTGKSLQPWEVTVTGEGLKTRHLTGGETYTKPGRPPRDPITCIFTGATKEDGEFQLTITGSVKGRCGGKDKARLNSRP